MADYVFKNWSLLRVRDSHDCVTYHIFGEDENGWISYSPDLVEFDKGERIALAFNEKEIELKGDCLPTVESKHYEIWENYAEGRGLKWTDMTENVTSRKFLPGTEYQASKAETTESVENEAANEKEYVEAV